MKIILATAAVFLAALCGTSKGAPITVSSNDTQCFSMQFLQPHHAGLVEYQLLHGVKILTRNSLKVLYRAALELKQSVHFLQLQLSCRSGETIPPPHHHCFLQERDEQTFLYNATENDLSMDAHRLAADLCMLVNFTTALHSAICYEQNNHSGEYATEMTDIHTRFGAVLEALSNITGIPLDLPSELPEATASPDEGDNDEDTTYHPDESESPSVTRSNRHTRHIAENGPPPPPPPSPSSPPLDPSDEELLNQGASRSRRQAIEEAASKDRCSFPQSEDDQFLYIYEFYQAVWYLASDLKAMTQ